MDVAGPAGEDEPDGLEGVLGVVGVAEDPPADAVHGRPVAAEQLGEGVRVAAVGEPGDQVAVGRRVRVAGEAAEGVGDPCGRHG